MINLLTLQKSETYTPVYSSEIAEEYFINYNPDVHGYSGPVQVSYPKYFYPQSSRFCHVVQVLNLLTTKVNLFEGLNYLGVPTEFDPNDGTSAGAAFVPTDLDPNNQTRSDARRTYYDPYATRENFHVITGQHVTRIILDGVSADEETSNPTYGGDSDGDGSATTTQDLGFGPGSSPPAATNLPSSRLRRDSCSSDLHVSGVEVRAFPFETSLKLTNPSLLPTRLLHDKQSMLREKSSWLLGHFTQHNYYNCLV